MTTPEQIAAKLTKAQRAVLGGAFIVRGQASYRNGKFAVRGDRRVLYNLCRLRLINGYIGTPLLTDDGLAVRAQREEKL